MEIDKRTSSQIHDWMKEQYPDLPVVCGKTVYNFVETVRRKYNLDKEGLSKRVYEKMPDIDESTRASYAPAH